MESTECEEVVVARYFNFSGNPKPRRGCSVIKLNSQAFFGTEEINVSFMFFPFFYVFQFYLF